MAAAMSNDRAERTRARWLETLARYKRDPARPGSPPYWSPSLDCASRDELRAIQNAKLAALTPFLSTRTAPSIGAASTGSVLLPTDIQTVDDLPKWPVVDKTEMMDDAKSTGPFGTYTTHDDARVGDARLDDVFLIGLDRRAPGLSLFAHRSRPVGVGERAGTSRLRHPAERQHAHLRGLRSARVRVGCAVGARHDGCGVHPRRRNDG